jgi:hypothetical protein
MMIPLLIWTIAVIKLTVKIAALLLNLHQSLEIIKKCIQQLPQIEAISIIKTSLKNSIYLKIPKEIKAKQNYHYRLKEIKEKSL